jgi:hypothetical protein
MQKRLEAYYNGIRKLGRKKKEEGSGGKEKKPDTRKR